MRATARESQVGPQRSRVPCRNRDQPMSYQQEGTSNEKRDQACGDMKESFSVSDSKPLGDQPRSHDPARVCDDRYRNGDSDEQSPGRETGE